MINLKNYEAKLNKLFIFIVGLTLLTPLIFIKNILRPYIVGKMLPFQFLVAILAVVWALLMFIDFKKYKPKFNLVSIAMTVFIGAILLSVLFSSNIYRSFWGNAERMEGFVAIFHFYVFAMAIYSVLRFKPETVKKLILFTISVSLLAAIYPALQKAGVLFSPEGDTFSRPTGSFGNPTFLSGYLLVHLFLGVWFLFFNHVKGEKFFHKINLWVTICLIVDLIGLFWMQTRGSFVGLFLAILFMMICFIVFSDKKKRTIFSVILGVIILLALLFFVFRAQLKDQTIVKKIPILERLAEISLNDSSTRSRIISWGWSLKWFTERPIFGVGQDMFYSVFDDNYDANNNSQMSERFDRSHNKFIDTLVMNGAVGFLAYLFLLVSSFMVIFKEIKSAGSRSHKLAWASLGALLIAYIGHNFFVFDTPANSLMFYFFTGSLLALTNSQQRNNDQKQIKESKSNQPQPLALLLVVIVGLVVIYCCDIKPYKASRLTYEAVSVNSYDLSTVIGYFQEALDQHTFINSETRKMLGDYFYKYLIFTELNKTNITKNSVISAAEKVMAEIDKGYKHEAMIDFYVYKANIYAQLSRMSIFSESEAGEFEQKEEQVFLEMSEKWPKRTDFYILFAEDQLFKGNIDKAKEWTDRILAQTPDLGQALWLNAALLVAQGGSAESILNFMNSAVDNGYRWDINQKSDVLFAVASYLDDYPTLIKFLDDQYFYEKNNLRVSETNSDIDLSLKRERIKSILDVLIYISLREKQLNYEKLIVYFKDALEYNNSNADYWARLAAAYAQIHDKENAIFAAQKAAELDPDSYSEELPLFIEIIQNGQWDRL